MPTVPDLRRRLMLAILVLLATDVVAGAFLLSPLGRSRQAREEDYDRLRVVLKAKRSESLPLRGMDKKLVQAESDLAGFDRDHLPAQASDVPEELGKLAAATGVRVSEARYGNEEAAGSLPASGPTLPTTCTSGQLYFQTASTIGLNQCTAANAWTLVPLTTPVPQLAGLQRVSMDATLAGDYLQLVRFLNALERDRMFFVIDEVTLNEQQGGVVRLQLKLETYLKGRA